MEFRLTPAAQARHDAIKAALESVGATFHEVNAIGAALDLIDNTGEDGLIEAGSVQDAVQQHIEFDAEDPFGTAENTWLHIADLVECAP